jgi:RimJ/RimL family protein N-acetyltransferase
MILAQTWVEPVTLSGTRVRLEPLSAAHLDDLARVAFDPAVWRWMTYQPTDMKMLRIWLQTGLTNAELGTEVPFATIDLPSGRAIGSTRYLAIVPEHRRLEIAWTWIARDHWRSGANMEAKLLQLSHAFEVLDANRVEFKTDSLNEESNAALPGIGATFEGTFRNHMIMPGGRVRHSNYYSVIAEEWPDVKARLEAKVAGSP